MYIYQVQSFSFLIIQSSAATGAFSLACTVFIPTILLFTTGFILRNYKYGGILNILLKNDGKMRALEGLDEYVPVGSKIDVGGRRTLIAATAAASTMAAGAAASTATT